MLHNIFALMSGNYKKNCKAGAKQYSRFEFLLDIGSNAPERELKGTVTANLLRLAGCVPYTCPIFRY
jgi:hypothetical protein